MFVFSIMALGLVIMCYYFGKGYYEGIQLKRLSIVIAALSQEERERIIVANLERYGLTLKQLKVEDPVLESTCTDDVVAKDSGEGEAKPALP